MKLSRRDLLLSALAARGLASAAYGDQKKEQQLSFDTLFAEARQNQELMLKSRDYREGFSLIYNLFHTKKIGPRLGLSSRPISPKAEQLIIFFEVSGESLYSARWQRPTWPGGDSGVTIGIGYDLGYASEEWLQEDWGAKLSPQSFAALKTVCGKHGQSAEELALRASSLQIPWDLAVSQFKEITLKRFVSQTIEALPIPDDFDTRCLGALVSLVYNRGPSFESYGRPIDAVGDQFVEMRNIKRFMIQKKYDLIPEQIQNMKRIWATRPNSQGLLKRRDMEAALFKEGRSKS